MLCRIDFFRRVPMLVILMHSSETSFLTRVTLRNIQEDGILHSHLRGHLKSFLFILDYLQQRYWLNFLT
jgi:hypothetical protein